MPPRAVDARKRLDRSSRFPGQGLVLLFVLDQWLWPTERFVSESCADLTRRRQPDHEVTSCASQARERRRKSRSRHRKQPIPERSAREMRGLCGSDPEALSTCPPASR
jgi:hypothetical protein